MKGRIVLIILLLLCCNMDMRAQEISLDTVGRLYDLKLTRPQDQITVKVNKELDAKILQNRIKEFFLEKISVTLLNLDDPNQLYQKYYTRLWTKAKLDAVINELDGIKKWLEDGTVPATITYLDPFYKKLQALRGVDKTEDWYKLNGNKLPVSVILGSTNIDKSTGAYVIALKQNNLFNKFTTDLFMATYTPAANSDLNGLSVNDYLQEELKLKQLLNRAEAVLKKDINNMERADSTEMEMLSDETEGNRIIKAIGSNSAYFTNWIWLRTGEITINPFEKKGKDTLTGTPGNVPLPRSRNKSLLKESTQEDELLNRILLSHNIRRTYRNIHFFRLAGRTIKQDKEALEEPVRGDERIKVNMHNTRANETLELVLTDTSRHNGLNETLNNISAGIGILADAYRSFSSVAGFIGTALTTSTINKALKDRSDHPRVNVMNDSVTVLKVVLDALKADLTDSRQFNPYIFGLAEVDPAVNAFVSHGRIISAKLDDYLNTFLRVYSRIYDKFARLKESAGEDSLLLATTYNNVYESNLPPATVQLQKGSDNPVYRTEILETDKLNDDLTAKYLVKSYVTNGAKTDSFKLVTFAAKNAKLKWMVASAGLMFTVPDQKYGINTFTGGDGAAAISTKRKTTSFVVGLNIYVKPINMLDNHWGASKNCPWYSRASLFIGLDVPDIMYHFYPGISYDILPGLKITGGAHIYRHTKFEIRNNAIQKQGDVLRGAGPFLGINIDPNVILKVVNLFNNK